MTSDAQILARPAATGDGADPRRWLTLIILLLAAFMNLLDVSIVNIAIPSIQRDLNASYADVQWALARLHARLRPGPDHRRQAR